MIYDAKLLDYDLDIMKLVRLVLMFTGAISAQRLELSTALMNSTFEILGPAVNGKGISFGTAFLIVPAVFIREMIDELP